MINISQNNIADIVEFDAGGGVQELFTATNTGVWETNWGNGQSPSSSNIIANLSGVKKILFHAETVSGVTTYQIYLMTNAGVKQYWWNANSNGIQSGTIYAVSNPVAMAFGTSPSGVDEIFTATAGAVEESSFAGGGITNTPIIGISQNNITAIDKLNSSGGTEILSTATTTGDWDSNWTTGSPSYTPVVNNFSGSIAVKRRFDTVGNNQLYLANGGTVEQYWWGSSGNGSAPLITISQNNISTIDEDQNGSYEQLYTGAGHIAYETYWGPTNGTGQIINTDTQIANGNVL